MRTALLCLLTSLATMGLDLWLARRIYGSWPWTKIHKFPWEERP